MSEKKYTGDSTCKESLTVLIVKGNKVDLALQHHEEHGVTLSFMSVTPKTMYNIATMLNKAASQVEHDMTSRDIKGWAYSLRVYSPENDMIKVVLHNLDHNGDDADGVHVMLNSSDVDDICGALQEVKENARLYYTGKGYEED